MTEAPNWAMRLLLVEDWAGVWLAIFGLVAQTVFMARFAVQWIATERARASVVPEAFWWLSLCGAALLLLYGILRRDVVIIAAQLFGFAVYARNLSFIRASRRSATGD